jgi:hypothetical protein
VLPVLFLIIFGFVEFGPLFKQWSSTKNLANDAARASSIAGTEVTADYDIVQSVRRSLSDPRYFRFMILYRSASIGGPVPQACLDQAAAKINDTTVVPVGAFQATPTSGPPITDYTSNVIDDHGWDTPPFLACSVYYPRHFVMTEGEFIYDKNKAKSADPLVKKFSLNRFWPSQNRVDFMSGPQDYVGIYIETWYPGSTGIIPARKIGEVAVNQIEPKRYSRNGGA